MKKGRKLILITAAVLSAVLMSGCSDRKTDWEDTLPATLTEASSPTVICETEETTTTAEPTIVTTEKTKRTAASKTTPELATTTSATSTFPTDISNVPISEFTSSTAYDPSTEMKPTTNPSESSNGAAVSSVITETEKPLTETGIGNVRKENEILRPYSYNQLNEKQLYIYDAVIAAAETLKTDVPLSTVMDISVDDYCDVYQQIYNDEHALFYIDTKMQYTMNSSTQKLVMSIIFYKYSDEKIMEMQKAIDTEVQKVLAGVTADMTEYDKVKYFHDYLASSVVYDDSTENCRDIYGVFVDKKAICGGYSKAFSYLCDKVGIETATVTGDADGEPHMWNKVKIDGQWYNIDITYAVTDSEVGSYVRYDYFCVTDEMLSESRSVYEQIYVYPEATSEDCNYYVKNGLIADSWEDAKAMLMNQIAEVTKTDEFVIQVKCSSKETYDDVIYRLFNANQKQAIHIFEDALPKASKKYNTSTVNYSQDKTSMVVKLFLDYTE